MKDRSLQQIQEENKRLHRAVDELSILNDLARAISSTLGLEQIMEMIVKKCIKTIKVEQGTVTLLTAQETALPSPRAGTRRAPPSPDTPCPYPSPT